jgi:hypothetical protein
MSILLILKKCSELLWISDPIEREFFLKKFFLDFF